MEQNFETLFYQKMNRKRHRVILSITCSVIRSILILIPTMLMRNIYNSLELGKDSRSVLGAILLTFVLPIIVAASYSLDIRMSKYIFVIIKEIRVQAILSTISQRLRTILALNKGDLFNRMVISLEELGEYYYYFINTSSWYITTTAAGILLMAVINWRITLFLMIFVLLQIGCSLVIRERIEKVREMENRLQAEGSDYVARIMTCNSFIKTALLDERELNREKRWEEDSWKVYRAGMINSQIVALLSFLLTLMRTLYLFFAAHALFLDQNMLKGDFIALNSYIIWLTPVFLGLQESIEDIIKARANKRRVNECLRKDAEPERKDGGEKEGILPEHPLRRIEVSELSFTYEGAKKPLFSGLNFQVRKDEPLFIVGDSGAGKSTLLNILMGLENAYGGEICYNEINLKSLESTWLHRNVIMVGQEVDILPATLRENILYSGAEAEDQEIIRLLHALKIGYLLDMPQGLDWDMRQNPRALSDGEKKRIAIARAILGRPGALLLDEPTAGLDNINKTAVTRFIRENVEGLLIIVTHDRVFEETMGDKIKRMPKNEIQRM